MAVLLTQADEFTSALAGFAPSYGIELTAPQVENLRRYYEHVMLWNKRLHLVAPCSPTEFATRHVLESLLAVPFLTARARVADLGSGAGLPIIPCSIVRPVLRATLFEANAKKSIFLREALRLLEMNVTARVINERFETTPPLDVEIITSRALDRFTEMFPKILEWSQPTATLLLFGGHELEALLERHALTYRAVHIPESERRFLFIARRAPRIKPKS
ncbi:MAG TPA: 16S rRNA (guanine(527)-N(7))-methyltransferase RsmG [Pyrinomonadaceae bacterium]|nr:16S rRNA (guanine(527)-N(7))-methyltransferase RsmG [Pyrinomonadaceae bacterium]